MSSKFPWETLKAETLRSICKDLAFPGGIARKREDMVDALKSIEKMGRKHVYPPRIFQIH
jgi:hypothetical protein